MDKILYICTGHQDSDYKVDYLLELLKKVKSEGGQICYGTHCNYRLEEISEYCDVIYDSNNEYLTEEFFYENCQEIGTDGFSDRFTYTYEPNSKISLKKLYSTSHSKPCFLNIKNVVSFAKTNNYEWIVYFEYDSLLPDGNLHDKIKKRICSLKNSEKVGYGYIAEDMRCGILFPHLFISKVDVFYEDDNFKKPCKTNLEFIRTYGSILPEEILFRMFDNNKNFVLTSAYNLETDYDYDRDMTESLSGREPFSIFAGLESKHNKTEVSIFKRECMMEFYPSKVSEGVYNLDFWLVKKNYLDYNFDFIKITVGEDVVLDLVNFQKDHGWYFDHVISNYVFNSHSETVVVLEYQVTLPSSEKYSETIKVELRYLDSYYKYKMVEYFE